MSIFGRGSFTLTSAARWSAEVYTTLIRGLPELVLMLLIFYGGQIGINKLADAQGWAMWSRRRN